MSIRINDLTVRFKNGVVAVNKASLEIPKGIYGLLGENGAGKTTLMRVLTTVLKQTEGMVSLDGILYNEGNYEKIQKKIGYLPQEIDLYPNLTVKECLVYMGGLSGVARNDLEQRITYYLEKTSLTEHQNKKMRQLSGGMKRRVGLIQALLNNPDFLIIDEPTTGLDPEERIRIRTLLVAFSKDRTVFHSCSRRFSSNLYTACHYEKGKFFIFWKREWVAGKCKGLCLELYGTKCRRSPFVRSQLFYII